MKQYTITPVKGTPDWSVIPTLDIDAQNWLPPVDISAKAQICYDEKGLYVHLRAWEKDIRAEEVGPLQPICDDSCLEFFLRPEENDPRYFNLEMNSLGFSYVGLCYDRNWNCRLAPDYEEDIFEKKINRLEDGWEIFYTVPVSFLQVFFPGFALTTGKKLYANCYKCGDKTPNPHYLSWNPCDPDLVDFHQIKTFGLMELG